MRMLRAAPILLSVALARPAGAEDPPEIEPAAALEVSRLADEGSSHPGLLGKRYVSGHYVFTHFEDLGVLGSLEDAGHGFDVTLNIPIGWITDTFDGCGMDAFFHYSQSGLSGAGVLPPPYNVPASFDITTRAYGLALAPYLELEQFGPVRPFMQFGLAHVDTDGAAQIAAQSSAFDEDDGGLLLALGAEVDLFDSAAARLLFDLDTRDSVDASVFVGELIFWPYECVFLSGAVIAPFNGAGVGALAGGGLTF